MEIAKNISALTGKTPLLELSGFARQCGASAHIVSKLERQNPTGSIKDRAALYMLSDAIERGLVSEGTVIIEPTSGNTGVGLAALCSAKGYRLILTMPDTMSVERRKLLSAYGAELVLTDGARGMSGAIEKANELATELKNSFIIGQFTNPANVAAHMATTGPEIWEDTDGRVAAVVIGVGTGGTLTGVGSYLKYQNENIQVIAVEPQGSPMLSRGVSGAHGIQGIGAGFVPEILDTDIYDEIIAVSDDDALAAARAVAKTDGILVGISSGAALVAAAQLAKRPNLAGEIIVAILPDTGERYLSVLYTNLR